MYYFGMKTKLLNSSTVQRRSESVTLTPVKRHADTGILLKKETRASREQGQQGPLSLVSQTVSGVN